MEQTVSKARNSRIRAPVVSDPRPGDASARWRKVLRSPACREYSAILSALRLPARLRKIETANTRAHREESERLGMEIAARGVSAECVCTAVSLFCESALPFFLAGYARHLTA